MILPPPQPPEQLLALLRTRATFVLAVHLGPDGDAMGSGLALYHALQARGKQVQLVAPTEVPRHYRWLPGAEVVRGEVSGRPEVALYLDCDGAARAGELAADLARAETVVQVDHHVGEGFGDLQYLDRGAAATTVLVYRLLRALQWEITPEIAVCLYTGMATDTGFFRFENTNSEVLAAAAAMAAIGAVPSQVAERVSELQPASRLRLRGRALARLQTSADGRIAWSLLRPEDYRETGTSAGDTEGVIDLLKQVEGQAACVLLKAPESDRDWQISLRSPLLDVAAVARQFGGGGHARAAGCNLTGSSEEVLAALLAALDEALGETGPPP
jgi:bifunctional oligoribonuclease and PAP phosphatase NrnA